MLLVGLTGNIASGKSTVARMFTDLGAHGIDADRIVHGLLRSGTQTHVNIVRAFGAQILGPDGEIDRRKLGQIVFSDADKRLQLNALTHPDVEAALVRQISDLKQSFSHGIVIVDAALMIETGGYKMYRRLIVVTCSPELQIERIMERVGMSEADARARMRSQMPSEEKVKLADYVIDTSGTLGQTRDQVEAIYPDLVELETQLGNGLSPF